MARISDPGDEVAVDELQLARACRGDASAFEALYRQHVGRVHGLCLRMTRNTALAEDCTQETFINAWRGLKNFQNRSAFGTWLHRIAVNTVLGRGRKGELDVQPELEESMAEAGEFGHGGGAAELEIDDLEQMIGRLPNGARNVVVLYGVYGYSHEETADLLGIAVGTCKAQLHRARKLLKGHLQAEGWA
jgi:RNA polymerase sigma-70 factor, ECF subfamily